MPPTRSVAIRIGTEGKAEVQNDFAQVRAAGEAAMAGIATASEQSADRAQAAADRAAARQQATWAKLAAAAKSSAVADANQQAFNTVLGVNGPKATDNGAGFSALADQAKGAEDAAAAALKLKAALDPLWAAQQRYDEEVRSHNSLLAQGAISEELHGRALEASRGRLREAENALNGHSNALGLNRMQFIVGEAAARNFVDSILAGQSPMRAFMQQAGDVATVLQMDDGGVAGGLAKVRALLSPTNLLIGASVIAVAAAAASWLSYANAVDKFNALAQGSGRVLGETGSQLEHIAEQAAAAGHMSVTAAREIETGYIKLGGIGAPVLGGLVALTRDFAAATGGDAKSAQQELGAAFQDPIKGAQELAARYGFLTQAQVDHIAKLVEQNDLYGAQQALLADLKSPLDQAADHVNILARAWHFVSTEASGAWNAMGGAIDRALGGGTTLEKIAALQDEKSRIIARFGIVDTTSQDAEISRLQAQLRDEQSKASSAAANAVAQKAANIVDGASGADSRDALIKQRATLTGSLGQVQSLDAFHQQSTYYDALTHAIDTWVPKQQKANELADIATRIAAASTPAQKGELAIEKARIDQKGEVISKADAERQAIDAGSKARNEAAKSGVGHAQTLAREASSMDVSARAALAVGDAYLVSSAAGLEAEARRKALTDATRKGIDVDEQVRRQLALQVAEGIAAGGRSIADLRDQTTVRKTLNDNVSAGTLAVAQMNQAMSDEAVLRPLLLLRANAQGDAYDRLTKLIDTYRAALASAHAEEGRSQAQASLSALDRKIEDARLKGQYAGDTSGAYDRAKAALDAAREAADHKYSPDQTTAVRTKAATAVDADLDAKRAGSAAQSLRSETDKLQVYEYQATILGKTDEEQQRLTARLQLQQQLAEQLGDQYDQFAPAILAARDAADTANQRLKLLADSMSELKSFGTSFVDDVLNPSSWSSWGNLGKTVIREIESEMMKLAIINPLKNLLTGSKLPGLGSIFSLFGGGPIGSTSSAVNAMAALPGYASGTEYASGGATWLAENGPEIVNLPRGARVTPAGETRRLLASNDSGPGKTEIHIHANDAVLAETVRGWVSDGIEIAAARGAQGGATLAEMRASKAAQRTFRR